MHEGVSPVYGVNAQLYVHSYKKIIRYSPWMATAKVMTFPERLQLLPLAKLGL
jgi:hypothetical protein